MSAFDLSEPITLSDGATYMCVEHNSGVMRLRSDADGQYRVMHIAEVAQQMVGVPRIPGPSPRAFETLKKKASQRTMTLADHIAELANGVMPGEQPRPEYSTSAFSLNQRMERKVLELHKLGYKASRATLLRKLRAFREQGAAGVIDGRSLRARQPLAHLDGDIMDALCAVIAAQEKRSTGTKSRLIKETQDLLTKRHAAAAPELPSESSMYRYIDALTEGKYTTGSAKNRQSVAGVPETKSMTRWTERLPGMQMQVDSTTLDMYVLTPDGKRERPILTVLFDVATRMIVAHTVRLTATKAVDHASLLIQALTPPQNRPAKELFRKEVQLANPQVELLGTTERAELEAKRPFIYPRTVVMDNGKDYVGDTFLAALQKFGIDVRFSPPHTPTTKAQVERNFGSLNSLFAQYQPGYTGNSPVNRGHKVEMENIMDIFALHELFDDWVLKVWNNRKHSGLRDRMFPTLKLTPNEMYAAAAELTSTIQFPLVRADYIELLPSKFATIRATGVRAGNREYDSPELHPHRHTKSNVPGKNGRWEVKIDPYNPHLAWVRSPDNQWIECAVRDQDYGLHPQVANTRPGSQRTTERANVAHTISVATGVLLHEPEPAPTPLADDSHDEDFDNFVLPDFDPTEG